MDQRTPEHYVGRKKELNDRYYLILNEMISLFPKYKSHPDYPAYSKDFIADKGNLSKLQSDFFLLRNGLEKNMVSLGTRIKHVDAEIDSIEKENKVLARRVQTLMNGGAAAQGMFDDTRQIHNQKVLGNWLLGSTIVGIGAIYYKSRT